jgi:uncharacterized membrane protein YgcG
MSGTTRVHPDDEDRVVREMTRELEAAGTGPVVEVPVGFADRVMAAVVEAPLPQPARAFGLALAAGRLRAAASSVGDAWRVAVGGFAPAAVRAQALALVLVVAVASITLAGGATVGALGLLASGPSPTPSVPTLTPTPSVEPAPSVSPSPDPTENAEPTPSTEPTATGTDDHGGRSTPTPPSRTPEPTATGTDDHGGNSGPGGGGGSGSGSGKSGSGSDSGSGGGATPTPAGTDDHGGGGDG